MMTTCAERFDAACHIAFCDRYINRGGCRVFKNYASVIDRLLSRLKALQTGWIEG
jgi:hypothetical protein